MGRGLGSGLSSCSVFPSISSHSSNLESVEEKTKHISKYFKWVAIRAMNIPIIRNRGFLQAGTGRALGTCCICAIHTASQLSSHSVAIHSDLVSCSQTNAAAGPYGASIRISVAPATRIVHLNIVSCPYRDASSTCTDGQREEQALTTHQVHKALI